MMATPIPPLPLAGPGHACVLGIAVGLAVLVGLIVWGLKKGG